MQWHKESFVISDDAKLLDKNFFVDSLHATYWAEKRSEYIIEKSLLHSTIFSLFIDKRQIGFARVISDFATYAYICDFFIAENYRQQGLGSWLLECILHHPVTNVSMITLATRDAHDFYRKLGFTQSEGILKKFMIKRKDPGSLDACLT